ncbi:MAG: cation-binding hemerythrin HHE [Zoogloea sp.]|nr:cation-binding hemerythrin HHE [Zoogloea sp.]
MEWTEKYELGLAQMDETHREFVDFCTRLQNAPQDSLLAEMDAFIAHTEAHFDQENRWMAAIGFPDCHKGEHDRVLIVIRDVRARMERGDWALGRRLIEELEPWFDNHAASMDAALAHTLLAVGFDTVTGEIRNPQGDCGSAGGGCGCSIPQQPQAAAG